jgi:hypothetical protein
MIRSSNAAIAAAFLLLAALAVAACGGAAATTNPDGVTPTPTPVAGAATPTPADGETPPAGAIPSFDLSGLTAALPVDSYVATFSVDGTEQYHTVVVTKPELSKDITTVKDGVASTRFIVIGKEAWTQNGPDGKFTEVPEQLASTMLLAYDPSTLLAAYSGVDWTHSSTDQGSEQKNGVQARHLHIDASTFAGGAIAFPAGASIDAWVADAGYIVAWEMTGFGAGQSIAIEITNIDDPSNKVERPS